MRIGFISTRFHGTDGVSLEASKWANVLEKDLGHECFWFAGKLDTPEEKSMLCGKAFFGEEDVISLHKKLFEPNACISDEVRASVVEMESYLKSSLENFLSKFSLDLVVPQNVLAIPMHVPMGLAVTNLIDNGIPTIAHHHDFYWERERFLTGCAKEYLDKAFPPPLRNKFEHVVINSAANRSLKKRLDIESTIIPNVFDFENPPPTSDGYGDDFKEEFGIDQNDIMILQPTRVVPRKGIELSIELCSKIQARIDKNICLVVSHLYGDEGIEYYNNLVKLADRASVNVVWAGDRVGETRGFDKSGRKIYKLWDIYPIADFVTYPSLYEGFGNALLETFYFSKPALVNRYQVYKDDIEPHGFKVLSIDGRITEEVVNETIELFSNDEMANEWTKHNYKLCVENFSYNVLRSSLEETLLRIFN